MQILPVDLTSLVAVILGISVVLVPVIGLTARFALKPTVEALGRFFEGRNRDESIEIMRRRLELQEQEIDALREGMRALTEAKDFDRQLAAPPADSPVGRGPGPSAG